MVSGMTARRPELDAWSLELIRVTAFPAADAVVTPDTWWKDLLGEESSTQTIQRVHLLRQEQGEMLGGLLTLTVRPGRIDWALSSKPREEPPESFPAAGKFMEAAPQFLDLMTRWISSCPALLDRLALGLNAWTPAADHTEAYAVLGVMLPSVDVDPATTDLRYQVNRPRPSRLGIPNLRINRLMAWSAVRMEVISISGRTMSHHGLPLFACRVELDINTAPDFANHLPHEALPNLLRELWDLGAEILKEGERP